MEELSRKLILMDFFRWWYGTGKYGAIRWWFHFWKIVIFYVIDTFSLRVLIPALITFQPWKKDRSIVGRGVAFFMRLFMIVFGSFFLLTFLTLATVTIIFWSVLIPLGIIRILLIFKDYSF
jgi:hypothetical protein